MVMVANEALYFKIFGYRVKIIYIMRMLWRKSGTVGSVDYVENIT